MTEHDHAWLFGCNVSVADVHEPSAYTTQVYQQGMDNIAAMGFDAVEIPHVGHLTEKHATRIARHAQTCGLQIVSVHANVCQGLDAQSLEKYRRLHTINVHNAVALGAPLLVEHTATTSGPMDQIIERKRFDKSVELAARHGVMIAIENGADDHELIARLLNALPAQHVGFTLDAGHANLGSVKPLTLLKRFAQRLIHLHAHENGGKFDEHLPIGTGHINWTNIFTQLAEMDYRGAVVFEAASAYARRLRPNPVQRDATLERELSFSLKSYRRLCQPVTT